MTFSDLLLFTLSFANTEEVFDSDVLLIFVVFVFDLLSPLATLLIGINLLEIFLVGLILVLNKPVEIVVVD